MTPLKLSSIAFKQIITNERENLFAEFSKNHIFDFLYSLIEDEYNISFSSLGCVPKQYNSYRALCELKIPISIENELQIAEICASGFWIFFEKFKYENGSMLCFIKKLNYNEVKKEYSKYIEMKMLNNELLRFVYSKVNRYSNIFNGLYCLSIKNNVIKDQKGKIKIYK